MKKFIVLFLLISTAAYAQMPAQTVEEVEELTVIYLKTGWAHEHAGFGIALEGRSGYMAASLGAGSLYDNFGFAATVKLFFDNVEADGFWLAGGYGVVRSIYDGPMYGPYLIGGYSYTIVNGFYTEASVGLSNDLTGDNIMDSMFFAGGLSVGYRFRL